MLLINDEKNDNQYLAYLLYDLLTNDLNGNVDTQEQIVLFDSFPLIVKQCFRDAMKKTIQYTNDLSDFDINKIPIEQQICLLNATDNVKEKAMQKLKEVKSKSEDSCSKARQYLDGLLKIPFNIYRKEPVLHVMDNIKSDFKTFLSKPGHSLYPQNKYTNIEINKYINEYIGKMTNVNTISHYKSLLKNTTKIQKLEIAAQINAVLEIHELTNTSNILTLVGEIKYKNKTIPQLKESIEHFIDGCFSNGFASVLNEITKLTTLSKNESVPVPIPVPNQLDEANKIKQKYATITNYTTDVKKVLDSAVYGHDKAKKQIERIIGQWLNGEQDGYCFGFEGPPGVGKTSLGKKGLSGCLNDENGVGRPFAMIQMGGDSNGSSLHGHNYTYVGSTWGSIVQILIDKKCMNPIIFIDEVDKISKTEHGKEIIGILTHLLDPSQNDSFQDKC